MSSAADSAKAVALAALILHGAEKEITPEAVEKILAKAGVKATGVKQLLAAINTIGLKEIVPDLSNMTPTAGAAAAAPAAGGAAADAPAAKAAAPKEEEEDTDFGMDLF